MITPNSLRESLELALVEDPDDLAAHMAYADHLIEQGDPWGEFIQTQLALEERSLTAAHRKKLQQRERELFDSHGAAWLGELAPFVSPEPAEDGGQLAGEPPLTFRRGWPDRLHIGKLTVNYARALARSPQARLLRDLRVGYVASNGEQDGYPPGDDVPTWEQHRIQFISLHPLLRSSYLGNVRQFHLGQVGPKDDSAAWEGSYTLGPAAADLIARMPRIEEVCLWTRGVDLRKLFSLPMPHLRRLQVYHHPERHPLELLAANPSLARLEAIQFHPHFHREYSPNRSRFDPGAADDVATDPEIAYIPLSAVTALAAATNLPNLRHLQLRLSSMGDEGVRRIIASGLLKRLEVLDLRHGCVTDEGALLLAECPDVRRLRRLDLNRNRLTAAGIGLLEGLGIDARVADQWGPATGGYPQSYLQEGDFE